MTNPTGLTRAELVYLRDVVQLINDGMSDIAALLLERWTRPGKFQARRIQAMLILVSML